MKIYLAGLVPKGDHEAKNHLDWRQVFIRHINGLVKAEFIDPRDRIVSDFDESDFEAVFGLDCKRIKDCDLLLVNGDNLGVGGAQEILIAKYFNKPVIIVLPKNTIHRRVDLKIKKEVINDWIHPFLYSTCDLMVDDVKTLTKNSLTKILNQKPKDLKMIDRAIKNVE